MTYLNDKTRSYTEELWSRLTHLAETLLAKEGGSVFTNADNKCGATRKRLLGNRKRADPV